MKTFRFVLLLFLVLSISNTAWAQNQTVKGRVIDSKLKEALMGVSILEIGTSNGTVTDLDGNFLRFLFLKELYCVFLMWDI